LHEEINRTLAELQKTAKARSPLLAGLGTTTAALPARVAAIPPKVAALLPPEDPDRPGADALLEPDQELGTLKAALAAKRQEIATLEEGRQRQLAELRAHLAQLTTVYTQTHPSVVSAQETIGALSRESPQAIALKA